MLAIVPVLVWGYVFYLKKPERRSMILITFLAGATSVFPILLYKFSWQYFPWLNFFRYTQAFSDDYIGFSRFITVPLSVIITFIIVGIIEETMKNFAVRVADEEDDFKNIDDVIQFSIIAALGFSFTENIMYFYNIWIHQGGQNILAPFVFRSIFSSFAHVMFSGIFGYFYGLACFAKPILKEELKTRKLDSFFELLYRWRIKDTDLLFRKINIAKGLVIAAGLHAIYNVFLELNWTFILIPYLVAGFIYINHLFDLKQNHKQYGMLETREVAS
ncbi:TPA: hypothetical protein DCZ16_00785 [Candidatus Peregrinibacteria bacterium]|nr:hypothetical protein [Candidatus Peregrinibacteria bacterium]